MQIRHNGYLILKRWTLRSLCVVFFECLGCASWAQGASASLAVVHSHSVLPCLCTYEKNWYGCKGSGRAIDLRSGILWARAWLIDEVLCFIS
jgi:hypothetical protein